MTTTDLARLEPLQSARAGGLEVGFWYFYHFLTERGRAGLTANEREITATDGRPSARHFTGPPHVHHQVPNAGHNLPKEAPGPFADAIMEVTALRSQNALKARKD